MKSWTVRAAEKFVLGMCLCCVAFSTAAAQPPAAAEPLPWISVAKDGQRFVEEPDGTPFQPWGFNYDRDARGRLLEDYWLTEWPTVEEDFAEMRQMGANAVRVHLQFGKFMDRADAPNQAALEQLRRLIHLAEQQRLYLNLTGLGCYHQQDVPDWYDALDEAGRWQAQAAFWRAVAHCAADSAAVFCYDLMNEPVVPGARRAAGDWLGPAFAGKHYVQFITLDAGDRERTEVARQWIDQLVTAIREVDPRHLITVGMVDWSLDRPGLTSGFVPDAVARRLDFISEHLYPEQGKHREAIESLRQFEIGKPLVIEETFPLKCNLPEMEQFIVASRAHADGWLSFYWGQSAARLQASDQLADAILLAWLRKFQELAPSPTP